MCTELGINVWGLNGFTPSSRSWLPDQEFTLVVVVEVEIRCNLMGPLDVISLMF